MLRETPASLDEGSYIFGRPDAQMLTRGRLSILSLLLRGCQQAQDWPEMVFAIDDFRTQMDARIADVHGRAHNQLLHVVLAPGAEGAIECFCGCLAGVGRQSGGSGNGARWGRL